MTPISKPLAILLLLCASLAQAQPPSNHCYNPDGSRQVWYHQPDVFAFRLLGGEEIPATFPRSVVRAAYTRADMSDRLSIVEFAEGVADSVREAVQDAIRAWPGFECAFEVVRHVPGLPNTQRGWSAVDDQVLVTFRDPFLGAGEIADFGARHHLALTRAPAPGLVPGHCHAYTFTIEAPYHCETGGRAIDVCRQIWLQDSAAVLIAEPNLVMAFAPFTNDSLYADQWHIQNTAQPLPFNQPAGQADNDHDIDRMWALGFKGAGIRVAVVDFNGFDLGHEDMQGAFVDGWDAINNLPLLPGNQVGELRAHGMCVAGILAARSENLHGIAGVAPACQVVPIVINGSLAAFATGLQRAAAFSNDTAKMVHVLNLSLGSYVPSPTIHNEIQIAKRVGRNGLGMVIVGASGNDNADTLLYPAAWPELINTVGSNPIDQRKSLGDPWDYYITNWGSNYNAFCDVAAASCLLWATDHSGADGNNRTPGYKGNYIDFNGTSGAAPIVSGVCAMIIEANPNLVDTGNGISQVRDLIRAGAEKVHPSLYDYNAFPTEPGRSLEMGYGRLNGYNSLILVGMMDHSSIPLSPLLIHALAEKPA